MPTTCAISYYCMTATLLNITLDCSITLSRIDYLIEDQSTMAIHGFSRDLLDARWLPTPGAGWSNSTPQTILLIKPSSRRKRKSTNEI
jgi:hypothetical protein